MTTSGDSSIINAKRGIIQEHFFANMVGLSVCRQGAFTLYLGLVLGMKFSLHLGFTSLHIDNIAFVLAERK